MILTLYSFINFKFLFVYLNTKDMETGWLKEIQRHTGLLFKADKEKKRPFFLHFTLLFTLFFRFTFLQLVQRGEFTSRWHHSPFMHTPPFTSAWWQICRKTWRSISSSLKKIKSRFAFTSSNSLHLSEKKSKLVFLLLSQVYCSYRVSVESFNWPFLYKQYFSKYTKQSFSVFWSCLLNSMLLVQVAAKQQKSKVLLPSGLLLRFSLHLIELLLF